MKNIVSLDKNSRAFITTLILAEGVGLEHRAVMKLLATHLEDVTTIEEIKTFEMLLFKPQKGAGRPFKYAKLTELQATFLITLMRNSKKVIQFKKSLSKEFFKQRQIIADLSAQRRDPNWQNVRKDGKQVYFQKTEVIKTFVDYAIAQGSTNAARYYANFANMENTTLFFFEQKYKNMREVLTIKQLMQVSTADDVIEKALADGMQAELHYKEVFKLAKERIIAYAGIIGRSPVLDIVDIKRINP